MNLKNHSGFSENLRRTPFFLLMALVLSCGKPKEKQTSEAIPNSDFKVELINGYFPKNNIDFVTPAKAMVINDQENFERYFGAAQTMTASAQKIDFDKKKVVAIIAAPSNRKTEIAITKTHLQNNKLMVNYKILRGEKLNHSATDLKMFAIPRSVNAVDISMDND